MFIAKHFQLLLCSGILGRNGTVPSATCGMEMLHASEI